MAHGEGGGGGSGLRELLAIFSFKVETEELEDGKNKLSEFFEKTKVIGEGIAAAFAVEQLFEFTEAQAHAITAIEHMAAQVGISAEAVQAWQYAAKASGFEADKFTNAMSRLQVAAGSEQGAKSFRALGISVKDASGKSKDAAALFTDVAEAVKATEDPNKRAAIVTRLFGRAGRELLPVLSEGREGIEELVGAYGELGGAYTEEDIDKTKRFEKSQASLGVVWTGLKAVVARVLLPMFASITEVVTGFAKAFLAIAKNSHVVQAALVVFGAAATVFAVQMAIAASPVLLIAAAIGALILVVDEIITLLTGGDSLIGDAIDEMFGKDAHVDVVNSLKAAWDGVKQSFVDLWDVAKDVWEFFKWIWNFGDALGDKLAKVGNSISTNGVRATARELFAGHADPSAGGGSSGAPSSAFVPAGAPSAGGGSSGAPSSAFVPAGAGAVFGQYLPGNKHYVGAAQSGAGASGRTVVESHTHVEITGDAIRPEMVKVHHEERRKANRAHADSLPRAGE